MNRGWEVVGIRDGYDGLLRPENYPQGGTLTLTPERVLREPAPNAHLTAFGADGLEFTLNYWIDDPHNGQMNVRSEVNMQVLAALRAAGVGIPYPQRVVHLQQDPPAAQARAPAQPAPGAADGV